MELFEIDLKVYYGNNNYLSGLRLVVKQNKH